MRPFALLAAGPHGIAARAVDGAMLKKVTLFDGLSASQLDRIAGLLAERDYAKGTHVFHEGDEGHEFYVVLGGKVRISKSVPGIGEEALAILEPGAHFGEMALVDEANRSADAIAHVDCKLAVFPRDEFDQLMFTDKDIAYSVLWTFVRTLSARLRETNEKIKGFFALAARF
jgi:CRP/FNR family transcriptional regulator, cyclic AMP receptor protein